MRTVHFSDLGQPGVNIPVHVPLPTSMVGVNAYSGGTPGEGGIWFGGGPQPDVEYSVSIPGAPDFVRGKTPTTGYSEVPLPVAPGTSVDVTATYQGETQHQTVQTALDSGSAMAEFHFAIQKRVEISSLSIIIPVVIVVGLVGYWLWPRR